ncbi:MAG TPA: hypothetical protein VE088_00420 [Gaiellaceae bacterium]|nr:hypothetical protein [Gaiellaceae bacterium]
MLPLTEHWDGSSWAEVAVPHGPGLSAVVAPAAGDAWAFGSSRFAERWNGSSWHSVSLPLPRGVQAVELVRAAATSANDVWVVGSSEGATRPRNRALVEHWNGSRWRIVPIPRVKVYSELSGVTALSPKNIWAVGASGVDVGKRIALRTLVLHWNGRRWKRVRSPNPAARKTLRAQVWDSLYSVAGASAKDLWAVGSYFFRAGRRHTHHTLVVHWDGRRWTQVPSPSPGGNSRTSLLNDVTAGSASDVWAVGRYVRHGNQPLVEHWDGTRWSVVSFPGSGGLSGVTALSSDDAWAVGETSVGHWDGSAWSAEGTPGSNDLLNELAAVSPSDIWAVGLRLKY